MVFKIILNNENKEKTTTFNIKAINETQINITITEENGNENTIVIYEHGAIYINGKEAKNWKKDQ